MKPYSELTALERAERKRLQKLAASKRWKQRNREKVRLAKAAWEKANPDKKAAMDARYRAKHAERKRLKDAAWRAANRERALANGSRWRAANKDKMRANSQAWADANRERVRKQKKKWISKNPQQVSVDNGRRRARKSHTTAEDAVLIASWEKKWRPLIEVRCYWCCGLFLGSECHTDHIHPLAKGGTHSIGNVCISCQPCNSRKLAKTLDKWNRLLVSPVLF